MDKNYILEIIDNIWKDKSKWRNASAILKFKYNNVFTLLHELYPKVEKLSTKAWLYSNNMNNIPTCYCGNNLIWLDFGRGFTTYCSTKCVANSSDIISKRKITILNKYGVDHFSKTDDYKIQFKKTCQQKYGVDNPGQISEKLAGRAYKKSQTKFNKLVQENFGIYSPTFLSEEWPGVFASSKWNCNNCGNDFTTSSLWYAPLRCNQCYPIKYTGSSKLELSIFNMVRSISDDAISKERSILSGKELDIYVPSKKVAIEICGSYWHSDRFVDKNYHYNKFIECSNQGIKLLTLFDFDCVNINLIENMIRTNLSAEQFKRINARDGATKLIDSILSRNFQILYHIRGYSVAKYHIGFYYKDELIAVSSWGKPRYNKESNSLELIRLCSSQPINGLLGKMTMAAYRLFKVKNILSYVDLRYGNGQSYLASGYKLVSNTKPGYWYVDNHGDCKHRSSFTKKILLVKNKQFSGMTEFEITNKLGYHRIWDCGNKLFKMENPL